MNIRRVILFFLSFLTPLGINFALKMLFLGSISWAFLLLLCMTTVWVAFRPGYVGVAITLLWIALFFFLGLFALDADAPAVITIPEADFYGVCYQRLSVLTFSTGILTAVAGVFGSLIRSRENQQQN